MVAEITHIGKTMKVVYNSCYGGFTLSAKAIARLKELGVVSLDEHYSIEYNIARHDPLLVQVVEELGAEASGRCAELSIATIHGNKYRVNEYDGMESISEPEDTEDEWITVK